VLVPSRIFPSLIALLAAALCIAVVHSREPRHGLLVTRYTSDDFTDEAGPALFDTEVHFDGTREHPTPEWASGPLIARRTGFLEIPRDGNYVLGVDSADGSWLFLDGALLVQNGGSHPPRDARAHVALKRGLHALRIDTISEDNAPALTLGWRLPGEYSPFEPIPVAALFPERPAEVTPVDRMWRLVPWLLLLLAALLWWRRELRTSLRTHPGDWLAGALLFAMSLGVRLHGLLAEGETTDQWAYVGAGWIYARNLAAGIFDPVQWMQNREHPDIGKLIYGAAQFVFGDAPWIPNAAAAVLNALTVTMTASIGRRLFGRATGVIAGAILALLPAFIAHGRIAALDGPSAFFFTGTVLLLVRALLEEERRTALLGGAVLLTGLAIGTKLSNALLLVLVAGISGTLILRKRKQSGRWEIPWTLYGFPFSCFVPALLTWPWLWGDTARHLETTLHHWSFTPRELFLGREGAVPAGYFLASLFAVTPVGVLASFLVGVVHAARSRGHWLLAICWFLLPFAWTFTGFRQDGIRYVYSALPPFTIIAAAGLVRVRAALGEWLRKPVLLPMTVALVTYLGWIDHRIHPYYLDYFNEAVGGPSGVYNHRLFETGWWSEGLNEAVAYLNGNAPYGASWTLRGADDHTFTGLREDLSRNDQDPELIVTRELAPDRHPPDGYRIAMEVRVEGAPIVAIYRK
jgi:hypothetical protein